MVLISRGGKGRASSGGSRHGGREESVQQGLGGVEGSGGRELFHSVVAVSRHWHKYGIFRLDQKS